MFSAATIAEVLVVCSANAKEGQDPKAIYLAITMRRAGSAYS